MFRQMFRIKTLTKLTNAAQRHASQAGQRFQAPSHGHDAPKAPAVHADSHGHGHAAKDHHAAPAAHGDGHGDGHGHGHGHGHGGGHAAKDHSAHNGHGVSMAKAVPPTGPVAVGPGQCALPFGQSADKFRPYVRPIPAGRGTEWAQPGGGIVMIVGSAILFYSQPH